ncbi:Serine/threonine-protein kinase PknB [Bremerella volcania]|uniref:Serine/threonine-protein kinase PknB n=2 Tax=Bremerella volcania TaxID=2527984 RepID=A0A518CAT3_9BACT|nr:Serine/threonine-protein kinase PknB [Bremerella volcania]
MPMSRCLGLIRFGATKRELPSGGDDLIRIEVKKGPMQGRVYEFEGHDIFLFGRDEQHCHASIQEDPFVSRHHFLLEVNPPLSRLRDLGSRNGTFVNGKKHGGRVTFASLENEGKVGGSSVDLTNGDVITAGKTVFQVFVEEKKAITATCVFDKFVEEDSQEVSSGGDIRRTITELPPPSPSSAVGRQTMHELPPSMPGNAGRQTINELPQPAPGSNVGRQTINEMPPPADISQVAGRATMVEGANAPNGAFGSRIGHSDHAYEAPERQPGEFPILDGFEFKEFLGAGGLGEVYLARRTIDDSPVTVKFLRSRINVSHDARDAFLKSMQVSGRLRHRNIVQSFGTGSIGNEFYVINEYCDGGPLAKLFRQKKTNVQPKHIAVSLYLLLDGLAFAHEKGLVHRDLKPSNLLAAKRNKRWIPKIADFGLTKDFEKAGFSGMTATGTYTGSFPYMPREQLTDYKYVNPASDVFSMGASFYRIITGRYPRGDEKGSDPLALILSGEVQPLRKRYPGFHPGLADVLDTSLQTECCERFPNAREMQNALRVVMKKEGWL